jgi:homoserine dehydrogenase
MGSKDGTHVALLGFGTVGQSVARILCSGDVKGVRLTHIFNRQVDRKRADWIPFVGVLENRSNVTSSSDVDIVIEVVGGLRPALYDWRRSAPASRW